MKHNFKNAILKFAWLFIAALVAFTACKKDDDPTPVIPVEDGMYIKGDVTPFEDLELKGMFEPGINEVGQALRPGMFVKYVTIQSGTAGFNIVTVAGSTVTTWGPATVESIDLAGASEQPNITIQKGTIGTSGKFTVPADGLYHIIVDVPTETFVIAPVPYWAILGGATDAGWSDSQMPLVGAFDMNELTFSITDIVLREGNFKFRYGGGWKISIDGELVKVNTNFGGAMSGTLPNLTSTLIPGGADIAFAGANEGEYTVTLKWTVDAGFVSTFTKTGDVEPLPEYPENLYMIGGALNPDDSDVNGTPDGWEWDKTDAPMIPVHSKPYLFWKIIWLHEGEEFKFAPQKQWGQDFGKTGDATNGIFAKGGDNLPVPSTSGYYMVVVNLETEEIAVVDPKVYLIGATVAVGDPGWATANADVLFTVDNANEKITLTKDLLAGELRMYAWFDAAAWFTDWWQSEFMILEGAIEFRGKGDDQVRVNLTDGNKTINLNFKTLAGEIINN